MINRTKRSDQITDDGNQQGRGSRPLNGFPYLNVKDVGYQPEPAQIVGARVEADTFRKDMQVVALRLKFRGRDWLVNLREGNPNLDVLCDAWTEDETTWKGRNMNVHRTENDAISGKSWIRFDPVPDPDKEPEPPQGQPVKVPPPPAPDPKVKAPIAAARR